MKETYKLYSGKDPFRKKELLRKEEVQEIIDEFNDAIKNNNFQRHKHIVEMIPANAGRILDYGCGWGCITKAIAEKGNEAIGIDQFEGALEVARDFNSHENVKFLSKRITEFDEGAFDMVNSNQVLEHVHNPGIYLKNVNRVLKMGGDLVISVPNIINLYYFAYQLKKDHTKSYKRISLNMLENYSKDSYHVQSWEPVAFINLHASVGFEYVEHKFIDGMLLPFGKSKHVTVPWGGRYYHTKNKRLRNLSYTMLFKFRKVKSVDIHPED